MSRQAQSIATLTTALMLGWLGNASAAEVDHVAVFTIEGLHAIDIVRHLEAHPSSTLAQLAARGTVFTQARTAVSDSSPGLVGILTGATPNTSGVPYSPWWDRNLSPPGSDCSTVGTLVTIDDKYNLVIAAEDGGGGIDPAKLPRDPNGDCAPVWPHQMLRVNSVFSVLKATGGRTAWFDQHNSYNDLLAGPDGTAIDESWSLDGSPIRATGDYALIIGQDQRRIDALLNLIAGRDRTGSTAAAVPTLFGSSFISFNATQKKHGYSDDDATPSPELARALSDIDALLGRVIAGLKAANLYDRTAIFVTAKHGQSPIDRSQRRLIDPSTIPDIVATVAPDLLAQATQDTGSYLWLNDSSRTPEVVAALRSAGPAAGIAKVYAGAELTLFFPDPAVDPRAPDIVVQPDWGVIFDRNTPKPLEHGGFSPDDLNVGLIVSHPSGTGQIVKAPVMTTQIAPTILTLLGRDKLALDSVRLERTQALPGFD